MSRPAGTGRIGGLDLARGLAVLGMFGAHLDIGTELTADPASWAAVVDGRSSILFATLAGLAVAAAVTARLVAFHVGRYRRGR